MLKVTASEFSRNFGRYRETAQREAVAVTSHDRVSAVLVSSETYEEFLRLKDRATTARFVEELQPVAVQAIAEARMDPRHDQLNDLLDD